MKNFFLSFLFISVMLACSSCSVSKKFVQTDLYFGLSQSDGDIISDSAWNVFVHDHLSKVFSAGFTVLTSKGNWIDKNDKKLYAEPSRVIVAINKMNEQLSVNIDSLRNSYKRIFKQQAVLRVDRRVSAEF